jgi:FkbM family methyltransferase
MNRVLQAALLKLYATVHPTGILDTRWFRNMFERSYFLYKGHYEAPNLEPLRRYIFPDTSIIDVGANIGFFSIQFAQWITGDSRVIALEPEMTNFARLQNVVQRYSLSARVETINAAVADIAGHARLVINPLHPGDHKLGDEGVPVAVTTIDNLLKERCWPRISLIKVDVQGAESLVLAGSVETISRFRPVLLIEVDNTSLNQYGSSAGALIEWCIAHGYKLHTISRKSVSHPLTIEMALNTVHAGGYADILFLPSTV